MTFERRSFLLGVAAGVVVVLLLLFGVGAYLYQRGVAMDEKDRVLAQERELADAKRLGATCAEAIPHLRNIVLSRIDPIVGAHRSKQFSKKLVTRDLIEALNRGSKLASSCAIRASHSSAGATGIPLEQSTLWPTSNALSLISATLLGLTSSTCDQDCEEVLLSKVERTWIELQKSLG